MAAEPGIEQHSPLWRVARIAFFIYLGAIPFFAQFPILTSFQSWRYLHASPAQRSQVAWVIIGFGASNLITLAIIPAVKALIPEVGRVGSPLWFAIQPLAISSPIVWYICIWIAALINPLRRRIQDFIDWRFYRRRYNAEQALTRFASFSQNETDLRNLADKLDNVVNETMQPASAILWLRRSDGQAPHHDSFPSGRIKG